MRPTTLALLSALAGLMPCAGAADIDDARLADAGRDRANWLTYARDYTNQRFSPLAAINAVNVKKLAPRWIYQSGVPATFQATPIVADGVMYVSLPFNHVVALEAASGRELWRYEHKRRTPKMCCGPANRGVAVAYGKVFMGTVDARLVALDAKTGKTLWDVPLVDDMDATTERTEQLAADDPLRKQNVTGSTGVGANLAPVVYKGKVIIGITGVGFGLHLDSDRAGAPLGAVIGIAGQSQRAGFYAAFDAANGSRVWQFDSTIEQWEGEFRATTPDGVPLERDIAREKADAARYRDSWKRGGGSAWTTPAIDVERGLIYLGIGNPSPQMDDVTRPGDNLYTVSLVALDVETGRLKWQAKTPEPLIGGVLATAGGVVFTGEGNGSLSAFDAKTGALLWQFNCGAGVNAPPVAYEIDGTQYIAVAVGGSALFGYRQGELVIAFALPR